MLRSVLHWIATPAFGLLAMTQKNPTIQSNQDILLTPAENKYRDARNTIFYIYFLWILCDKKYTQVFNKKYSGWFALFLSPQHN